MCELRWINLSLQRTVTLATKEPLRHTLLRCFKVQVQRRVPPPWILVMQNISLSLSIYVSLMPDITAAAAAAAAATYHSDET